MAVEAPVAGGTSAGELAHLPKVEGDNGHALHVVADHQGKGVGDEMLEPEYIVNGATNGKGRKRSASPSQTENVGKIPWFLLPYHRKTRMLIASCCFPCGE